MTEIVLPKFLDIPEKLYPIILDFNKYRYFLLEGGRGSAKSQTVARFLLYLGDMKKNLRLFCGREIQNTIEESVYQLFKDLIEGNSLNYDVGATKIDHRGTGTAIRFRGLREQGAVNIKGIEGADILWIEEAQSITKETLKIIIPTIRKNNSKVFFTMNRDVEDDPVYEAMQGRDDCLCIHIDYFENKHCPAVLKHEAEECKKKDIEDYEHIWLGVPRKQAKKAAFRDVESIVDINLELPIQPHPDFHYVIGADLAKSVDYTVFTIICVELRKEVYWERLDNENRSSWNYQKIKLYALAKKYNDALVVTDSTGVGDPITEDLQRMGCNVFVETVGDTNEKEVAGFKFTSLSKDNLIEKLKVAIELQLIKISNNPILIKELKQFEATYSAGGRVKYSAPEGKDENGLPLYHDDCVISLALALWGTEKYRWFSVVMVFIAILFNPLFKVHFDRATWQIIDVICGVVFLTPLFFKKESK